MTDPVMLVGCRVVAAGLEVTADYGMPESWPYLVFEAPDGGHFTVVVKRDPEGNGPGFLDVEVSR